MKITDFTDEIIDEVRCGSRALTPAEREFLVTTVPSFEEAADTEAELRKMDDATLMSAACGVWAEYAAGQV